MYRIDSATAAASKPAVPAAVPANAGYFTDGDPAGDIPATIVPAWWLNQFQDEVIEVIDQAGITLDKADNTQLYDAIIALIAANAGGGSVQGASFIDGLTYAPNSSSPNTKIDIAPGKAQAVGYSGVIELASTLIKTTGSWAEGDDAGGLFSGTVANDTFYHVHLIRKDSDGTIDAGFDTSPTAANIPSGWTGYRRIGSFRTDGSANIKDFVVNETAGGGIQYRYKRPIRSVNSYALTYGSAHIQTLDTPTGIKTLSDIVVYGNGGDVRIYVTSIDEDDIDGIVTDTDLIQAARVSSPSSAVPDAQGSQLAVMTDNSRQIRTRSGYATATITMDIVTMGWRDERRAA